MGFHTSSNSTLPTVTETVDVATKAAMIQARDSHFKYLYFPLHARGELIRTILIYVGASWEEIQFDWPNQKPNLPPFHQVPVLFEINPRLNNTTFCFCEAKAIERYLAQKYGLLPPADGGDNVDPLEAQRLDEIYHNTDGVSIIFDYTVLALQGEARLEGARKFYAGVLKDWAHHHERLLKERGNTGYYARHQQTSLADLKTDLMLRRVLFLVPTGVQAETEIPVSKKKTPALWKLKERIEAHGPMTRWLSSDKYRELDRTSQVMMGFESAPEKVDE